MLTRGVEEIIVKEHFEEVLKSGKKLRVKFGIDPTAPDLHLGHTVPLRKLRQFQDAGHTAVLIIGDFTAMIGDPTGRNYTRPSLTPEEVKQNLKKYLKQAGKIINIGKTEVHYNSKWYKKMKLFDFVKLAQRLTVNQILKKEMFRKRLEPHWVCPGCKKENGIPLEYALDEKAMREEMEARCPKCGWHGDVVIYAQSPISLHEFLYPVLQAYDSFEVKADVEIGGTDQKFNILLGRDLQRHFGIPEQDVITVPILEGIDGLGKMSKSSGNYISLDADPLFMFGSIMRIPDSLIDQYYKLLTDEERDTEDPREAKLELAKIIVSIYHGEKSGAKEKEEFIKVFSKHEKPSERPKLPELGGKSIIDGIVEAGIAKSRGEARRLIEQGAVRINDKKISNPNEIIPSDSTIQVGPRHFFDT